MSTYPATAALTNGGSITARWLLDETDNNTRVAETGGKNFTPTGMASSTGLSVTNASFDNSASFVIASSAVLEAADHADFSPTGDFTFNIWVNLQVAISGSDMTIWSKYEPLGSNRNILLATEDLGSGDSLEIGLSSDGSAVTDSIEEVTMNTSTWYMVTVVYDASAGEIDFYTDGSNIGVTQTGQVNSIDDGTAKFMLGGWEDNGTPRSFITAYMQDCIFWKDVEFTASEVSDLYDDYTVAASTFTPKSIVY